MDLPAVIGDSEKILPARAALFQNEILVHIRRIIGSMYVGLTAMALLSEILHYHSRLRAFAFPN